MAKAKKTTTTPASFPQPQAPLILRRATSIDAFAKSDEERDFYLDRAEGFLIFVDLDRGGRAHTSCRGASGQPLARYALSAQTLLL